MKDELQSGKEYSQNTCWTRGRNVRGTLKFTGEKQTVGQSTDGQTAGRAFPPEKICDNQEACEKIAKTVIAIRVTAAASDHPARGGAAGGRRGDGPRAWGACGGL